ncbi:MAG: hypothetical protein NC122_07385 [Faecalibacterium sp.]|nr:hypothetical protein [Ruminococcus sp.]MCM1392182.1 hypothetical protein [Ruminococcus sp.]MCM1486014.1 hypothetical protein [Faecalibacterium sp.]
MWYIRIIGTMIVFFAFIAAVCWLSDIIEEYIDSNKAMRAENRKLKAELNMAQEQINHQTDIIRALEYTSKYPLFTNGVPVRERKKH